jgi:O-antigen/teichoic acid export membrane protein
MAEHQASSGAPRSTDHDVDARDGRDETELERWDRNLVELLQELRVAQTGVQILFAFLLTLPFTNRFAASGSVVKTTYLVTLLSAASASALLIAPVSFHRLVFRQGRKPELVRVGSLLAKLGLVCLLICVVGAVLLVVDVVSGSGWAAALAAGVAALYIGLWWVLPIVHHDRRR